MVSVITIEVRTEDRFHSSHKAIISPDFFSECWEPIKTNDDPFLIAADFGTSCCDLSVKKVLKLREDAANCIAKEIAQELVRQMSRFDTHNGYRNGQ